MSSENVVVVVNGDSAVSRTIANHYIHLRGIPTRNVIVLKDVPTGDRTDLETFRESILRPLLVAIDQRGIAPLVRTVAYSADFPTQVSVTEHHKKVSDASTRKYQSATASLTGLTYFYRLVLADSPAYFSFGANLYARGKFERHFASPFGGDAKKAFDSAVSLRDEGKHAEAADAFRALHEESPSIASYAMRAAESYSEAENDDAAIEMIRAAVKAGWWSKTYLEKTESLAKYLESDSIKPLLPVLDGSPMTAQGPVSFTATAGWALNGSAVPADKALPYLCACSLAVTHPNGSTLGAAVRILERASKSDRQFPKGRFEFTGSKDVRAKCRFPAVTDALIYLQSNGFETNVFRKRVPTGEGALIGLMAGTPSAELINQPWILVRGSIADNLTSYGGAFNTASQTKLTEFLSAGAAMSSGAVAEPYSIPAKFPSPMMYGYYAQGLSSIESFYQSIQSPYQILIVGDPLAQPFAKAPDELVDISLVTEGKKRIRMTRRSLGLDVPKSMTRSIEISIEDKIAKTTPAVPNIDINWPEQLSGVHRFRTTLVGLHRTEPRISFVKEIDVQGEHPAPSAEVIAPRQTPKSKSDDGTSSSGLQVKLTCSGADRIELHHLGKPIATVDGEEGTVKLKTKDLGGGPLRFRPYAFFGDQAVAGFTLVEDPNEDSDE